MEKSPDRLRVLEKIKELEMQGKFDIDAEEDPPTVPLEPDEIEFVKNKRRDKLKANGATWIAEKYVNNLVRKNKLIIKDVVGLENFKNIEGGAIITCNHFNPFDCFTVEKVFRMTEHSKKKTLYKIIREGNYTNFPGFYGFLFRNCHTLPLSTNKQTMIKLLKSVDEILAKGDFILIYPEQSLWWNYKKPKPLKSGAFRFASKNNVPIVPIFITMKETDIIGDDGFPIMEYYVHIEKPIYKDENLSEKENSEIMKNKNYEIWKKIYEDFYQVPLEYLCDSDILKEKIYG